MRLRQALTSIHRMLPSDVIRFRPVIHSARRTGRLRGKHSVVSFLAVLGGLGEKSFQKYPQMGRVAYPHLRKSLMFDIYFCRIFKNLEFFVGVFSDIHLLY